MPKQNQTPKDIESKLKSFGCTNISDIELLDYLVTDGKTEISSKLAKFLNKKQENATLENLLKISGIDETTASRLICTKELAKRLTTQAKIIGPTDAVNIAYDIAKERKEYLIGLFLNARFELICRKTISVGNFNQNHLKAYDIFVEALEVPSATILLVHNHPSGDPTPSNADLLFTQKIQKAAKLIGFLIVDHLIVAGSKYYSFKENDLIL